jgi:hypothetical protein
MWQSVKYQNGAQIQDGRQNILSFQTFKFWNLFKIVLIWLMVHLLQQRFFLKNLKWLKNSIWQIFCTKILDFLVAEPLNEMFLFFDMLYTSYTPLL